MDEDGDAFDLGEFLLGLDEAAAIPEVDTCREVGAGMTTGIVARHDDPFDAFDSQEVGDVGHRHLPLRVLSARHRHRAVVQQLVGDVDVGCHCGAHGQGAGVEEGAVTDVLNQVVAFDEGRDADPLSAFTAHLRQSDDVADSLWFHEGDHRVTPDAAADEGSRLGASARVVWAAGAVERCAVDRQWDELALGWNDLFEWRHAVANSGTDPFVKRRQQLVDVERAEAVDEDVAVLVVAANDAWPDLAGDVGAVVERAFDQSFEGGVLLFDHDEFIEAIGELPYLAGVEWNRHQELEEPDAGGAKIVVAAEPENRQRFAHLVERVPTGGDPEPIVAASDAHSIKLIVDAVLACHRGAQLLELDLHVEGVRSQ